MASVSEDLASCIIIHTYTGSIMWCNTGGEMYACVGSSRYMYEVVCFIMYASFRQVAQKKKKKTLHATH